MLFFPPDRQESWEHHGSIIVLLCSYGHFLLPSEEPIAHFYFDLRSNSLAPIIRPRHQCVPSLPLTSKQCFRSSRCQWFGNLFVSLPLGSPRGLFPCFHLKQQNEG